MRIGFTAPCEGARVPQLVPVRLAVPVYPTREQGAFVITGTVLTDATGRRLPEPYTFSAFHPLVLGPGTSEETGRPDVWRNNVIVGSRCAPLADRTRVQLRIYLLSPAGLEFAEREWRQSTPVRIPADSVLMDHVNVTRQDACR
ncbi:hypothetical protein [Streptomyces sp. NPDC018031]|uniref:hypothetical protein n=1 Tax=Streptomyces sp. NPDC018031 TaxID=3365033 RepID=UPI0037A5A941